MGLNLSVGILADLLENDEEGAQHFLDEFAVLNRYLATLNLPPHEEPAEAEVRGADMYGYSGLHYLRRIAAHLHYSGRLPEPGGSKSAEDPLLNRYFDEFSRGSPSKRLGSFDHLILHSDAEGYYLPRDFEFVLVPGDKFPVSGGMVGSSPRLLAECGLLAGVLELPLNLDPEDESVFEACESQGKGEQRWEQYGIESYTCLRLYHAARHSVNTGAAIVFT